MNPRTRGFFTSEFLTMVITQVVGVLVLSGKIAPEQQTNVTDFLQSGAKIIVDMVTLAYMLYTAYGYIKGRNDLKQKLLDKE